jgi:hypothetical protein
MRIAILIDKDVFFVEIDVSEIETRFAFFDVR